MYFVNKQISLYLKLAVTITKNKTEMTFQSYAAGGTEF